MCLAVTAVYVYSYLTVYVFVSVCVCGWSPVVRYASFLSSLLLSPACPSQVRIRAKV